MYATRAEGREVTNIEIDSDRYDSDMVKYCRVHHHIIYDNKIKQKNNEIYEINIALKLQNTMDWH